MAIQGRNTLKSWFVTLAKPLQEQFWDWLDSFRHKSEKITADDLDSALLTTINNLPTGETIEQVLHELAGKQDALGFVPENVVNKVSTLATPNNTTYPTTELLFTELQKRASIDPATSRLMFSQLPDDVVGNVRLKGHYSIVNNVITSTDTALNGKPLPPSTEDTQGWYFLVSDTGTINGKDFEPNDWLISNGEYGWDKVGSTKPIMESGTFTPAIYTALNADWEIVPFENQIVKYYRYANIVTLQCWLKIKRTKNTTNSDNIVLSGLPYNVVIPTGNLYLPYTITSGSTINYWYYIYGTLIKFYNTIFSTAPLNTEEWLVFNSNFLLNP